MILQCRERTLSEASEADSGEALPRGAARELLRVRGLPDAPQFIRLDGTVAGELQQPLDVVEDGGLVVGQRKLHLPARSQPGHLQPRRILSRPHPRGKVSTVTAEERSQRHRPNFASQRLKVNKWKCFLQGCGRLTFRVRDRCGEGAHSTSSWTSERGVPDTQTQLIKAFIPFINALQHNHTPI